MSEYKRLTERDEYGNADIIGVPSELLYSELTSKENTILTRAFNRLAELEDKIENGTLVVEKTCVYQEYNDYNDWTYWECSNCKEAFCFNNECTPEENQYHYCPNCGARITEHREVEND